MRERLLNRLPLFSALKAAERLYLSAQMTSREVAKGRHVFTQGTPSEALYLIESGWVRLIREEEGQESIMAEVGPGDLIGTANVFRDQPYSVTAKAASQVSLWVLRKENLFELMAAEPETARTLGRTLGIPISQLRKIIERYRSGEQVEAALPAEAVRPSTQLTLGQFTLEVDFQTALLNLQDRARRGWQELVAAVRPFMAWQATQEREVRIRLAVIAALILWLCLVSIPSSLVALATNGEGLGALMAAPTFTPTPTATPTSTPTSTPTPTNTPTQTPTPTQEIVAVAPTATPRPPTPTPTATATPAPTPIPLTITDQYGTVRDMGWLAAVYGSQVERASPAPGQAVYRVLELRERTGPSAIDTFVCDENGRLQTGVPVRCINSYDGSVVDEKPTDSVGKMSCGMGAGSYILPGHPGTGAYEVQVVAPGIASDVARRLSMLAATEHTHLDVYFRLVR